MKNDAAVYIRLSKEDEDRGEDESCSIRNQRSLLLDYAASMSWNVYRVYCDEDCSGAYSGSENDRPEFNRLIEDAEKGRFGIVLCKSQSRFSRNMEVIERYIHGRFAEWGIRFVSLTDNADTEVKGNKKARQINGLINEWYLEDLSENVKAVFRDKMKKGEFLAPFPPYGYLKDPLIRNHLVPDPETAPVVKQIFEWHGEGFGTVKISRMLNDRGIMNPRKRQEENGLRKAYRYAPGETGAWSASSVSDILHNSVYCGDVVQHKREKVSYKSKLTKKVAPGGEITIRDKHEPIIDRGTFDAAQQRMAKRRRADGSGRVHILSGMVFCGCCGKAMQKLHSKSTRGTIEYLRCREKYAHSENDRCKTPNIRLDAVLGAIGTELIDKFKEELLDGLDEELLRRAVFKNSGAETENGIEGLDREETRIERSLEHLYEDRLSEIITLERYLSLAERYNDRLRAVRAKRTELTGARGSGEEERADPKAAAKELLDKKDADRLIIEALIDRIEFGETDPVTNKPILKIFWAWE